MNPLISRIRENLEAVRSREMQRTLQRLKEADPETIRQIDMLTRAIVNKIAHPHMVMLKKDGNPMVRDMIGRLLLSGEENENDMDSGNEGSKLALVQTRIVVGQLRGLYPEFDFTVRTIKTTGDTVWDTPLYLIGQKGLFIKEIEEALASGEIDLAVHSIKDLPTELLDGLALTAVLPREDPRDAFLSLTHDRLSHVPKGAAIGTSSMRRKAQLLAARADLDVVPLRGNVDTRLRKLREQNLDGIILACAGVTRMGLAEAITEVPPSTSWLPPCGQGAIGVETIAGGDAARLVKPLDHAPTAFEVQWSGPSRPGSAGDAACL
jgi:hydroxymethylbilane synthase